MPYNYVYKHDKCKRERTKRINTDIIAAITTKITAITTQNLRCSRQRKTDFKNSFSFDIRPQLLKRIKICGIIFINLTF